MWAITSPNQCGYKPIVRKMYVRLDQAIIPVFRTYVLLLAQKIIPRWASNSLPAPNCICTCLFHQQLYPKQFFEHRVRLQRPNLPNQNECQGNWPAGMQYRRGGLCSAEKNHFMIHDAMALPYTRPRADKVQTRTHGGPELAKSGHVADKEGHMVDTHEENTRGIQDLEADTRRRFGGVAKADTWRTQSGYMADTWQTHKADTRRTQGRHMADKVWRRGKGGPWRTHSGQVSGTQPAHIAASPFSCKKRTVWGKTRAAELYVQRPGHMHTQTKPRPNYTDTNAISRAKGENKRQGANARRNFEANKSTAGKGGQTNSGQTRS